MHSAGCSGTCVGIKLPAGRLQVWAAVLRRHLWRPSFIPWCIPQRALQVAGETEVKGQVKLQFRTATGVPVIVTRSYMVSAAPAMPVSCLAPSAMTCMPFSRPDPRPSTASNRAPPFAPPQCPCPLLQRT